MTNSGIYEIAAPLIHETLSIRFYDVRELTEIAASICETGLGRPFLKHAKRVEIMSYPARTLPPPFGHRGWPMWQGGYLNTAISMQYYIPHHMRYAESIMRRWILPGI
ncbi:hypothetical protein BDW42DRAFT_141904 [Aspergillus taichungensis]|uniref:Uncharacterized protein n=1 Tax=Aspergillus taichungensis TaxID=482145 RepID=A0A2J5I6N4_9EURO|nr:hypothetical protein BDW42DRAFT_141904 [Aspergillus taichungensis]